MLLSALLNGHVDIIATDDREITGLTLDSRMVKPGFVFLALKGTCESGVAYIHDAISKGAAAVLTETKEMLAVAVPVIQVDHLRAKTGILAARFYDFPAKKMRMIGVTGTNGKTSCTHFIAQILQELNEPCGLIGTLGSGFYGALSEPTLTTPDAVTLQKTLHDFVENGANAVAMEVSSHSIDQGRVNGVEFEIGVFTNLTQDHLDYHGTMDAYAAVKRRFLAECFTQHAVLNVDDAHGLKWAIELAMQKSIFAYGTNSEVLLPSYVPYAFADRIDLSLDGMSAHIDTPWGKGQLNIPLVGKFNLSNALAALSVLCLYGLPFEVVLSQMKQLKPVPGRMQTLGGNGKPMTVIDYAHTPDALDKVLQALREHTQGKLICVFGCGGNRDPDKRPRMAKITEQWSDQVILTNDNPRHESPEEIASQIMQGFLHPERVLVELDRSKAIEKSIQCANENDCVLIAGKGAERYQQIGDQKIPFDDVSVAKRCLEITK